MVRINKYLAECNLGSRRKVEQFVLDGRIKVNEQTVKELSFLVDEAIDKITFDGKTIKPQEKIYLKINKPKNVLVTLKDDFGRLTITELLGDIGSKVYPIGRLDLSSEGLMLLTNDGDFANLILHPRNKLPKLYKVVAEGYVSDSSISKLRSGLNLADLKTKPAKVFIKQRNFYKTVLKITISEGQKRQIRRMLEAVGSSVLELKRLQIGDIKLDKLKPGEWTFLSEYEIAKIKNNGVKKT